MRVNVDRAAWAFFHGALGCQHAGIFPAYDSGDRLHEQTSLLEGIARLNRHEDVESRRTGSFGERSDTELLQRFQKQLAEPDNRRKICSFRGIEIKKNIIGIVL